MKASAGPRGKDSAKARGENDARLHAVAVANIAEERRGRDISVLHVEKAILITDYFILVSARNRRQIQAIAKDATDYLRKEAGYPNVHVEGLSQASWVLVDAGPLVLHVFRDDLRDYYDLELLWGDSPVVAWQKAKE